MNKKEDEVSIMWSTIIERWNNMTLTSRIYSKFIYYFFTCINSIYFFFKWHIYIKPRLHRCIRKIKNNE